MKAIRVISAFSVIAVFSAGCLADRLADAISNNCEGLTLEELRTQNGITDPCRHAVEGVLSDFETNFKGKLVAYGSQGSTLYVSGVSSSGAPLAAVDFQGASVTAISNGVETPLAPGDFTVSALAGSASPLMSISAVNDYSGSMRDEDIDTVAQIETELLTYLPGIYEGEVIDFSDSVEVRLPFSSSSQAVLGAVARDPNYPRDSTALYDAMGQGLGDLLGRPRPIRVLFVATDGMENSSQHETQDGLLAMLSANPKTVVIMLGTLFADVDAMKRFASGNGIFVYAPALTTLQSNFHSFLQSLSGMSQITIGAAHQGAQAYRVEAGGASVTFTM
jgi:hypothetical protein